MGGGRRPAELRRGTPWRLADTAARFTGALLAGGSSPPPLRGSLLARVRTLLTDTGTWRDLAWLAVQSVAGALGVMFLLGFWFGLIALAAPIWAGNSRAFTLAAIGVGLVVVGLVALPQDVAGFGPALRL